MKYGTPSLPFSRVCGLAALGFAAVIVSANAIAVPAGLPTTGAKTAEVTAFFGERGTAAALSSALTPLAWVLATLFGAGAVAVMWRFERERGEAWALVGFAGLVLQNTTFAGVVAVRLALASMPLDEATVTAAVWALHEGFFTLNGTFLALALLGLSVAGRRSGLIRPWHALLGMVAAALMLASSVLASLVIEHGNPLGLVGLLGWLLWVVWICAYGVVLIRLPSHRAPATA